ncbi:transposase B domain protein [Burkholderia pseudomallei MSHR7498]|nr:transposase B domain protein [Burkholderia pseudomallei]KGS92911.1 transposase B domain protein [Burkholderia pseudomallei MSHR7498]KGX48497.1 transposase B domain protein [Burkholderia pseudomallei MSHR3709]PNW94269.1 hypothetical protein CF649_33565 [Burkholderia sp. 136(2017)]PNX10705.1 hypothetical protein CF650_34190 [Burkholderia sp. 129]PNX24231.1 hypothetical protein CF647_33580 [Burkholderia sp. 117]PNX31002.1 hypothetical protein CF648_33570 [Burkholderia sp. 137]
MKRCLRIAQLNCEWFRGHSEANVPIERWRQLHNERRPRSARRYQPPVGKRDLKEKNAATCGGIFPYFASL